MAIFLVFVYGITKKKYPKRIFLLLFRLTFLWNTVWHCIFLEHKGMSIVLLELLIRKKSGCLELEMYLGEHAKEFQQTYIVRNNEPLILLNIDRGA